jgi:two-component system phosphate regulon response regulator PhoB
MLPREHRRALNLEAHRRVTRILVVESDPTLRAELMTALTSAGHEVESASSAQAGLALARTSLPDIIVFDLVLPDLDGIELTKLFRADSNRRPSLCVLTSRSSEEDRVAAFEAGVDDYVTKPHSMRELVLRLRSLSRRRSSASQPPDAIAVGALKIERAARRVEVSGSSIELTRREFDLLLHLAERAGRVQTRDILVAEVWGEIADSGRVVDTTIKRLRKKLGESAPPIRTIRGVGYKLNGD